jgi:hypothetical protein
MRDTAKRKAPPGGRGHGRESDQMTSAIIARNKQERNPKSVALAPIICAICDATAPFDCRHCRGIKHRLRTHPIPGFAVADMAAGVLLNREENDIWGIGQIPPALTAHVVTEGEA